MELCRKRSGDSFLKAISQSDLTPLQKTIIEERFVKVLSDFKGRCWRLAAFFHISRFIITVGSLIVPALLSIQYTDTGPTTNISDPQSFAYRIYWSTWVISLLVTTCNGIVSIFKIDKKYYFLHTTLEHLKSEGWQFIQLSGHYSGFHTPGLLPTHNNQFVFFCHFVEKIKMKQVEEEYYKLLDNHSTTSSSDTASQKQSGSDTTMKKDTIIPITPLKPLIDQAKGLPPELLEQIVIMAKAEPLEEKEKEEEKEKV